ncbi:MAG: redoxin domain-containing protein [Ignavibacteriales bacterium]|nr:redoxin domain-containing protein [Ignavibacteriales bacterium]
MKKIFFILLPFAILFLQAQEKQQNKSEKIKVGDLVNINFIGSNIISKKAELVICEAYIDRTDLEPLLLEIPMTKSASGWSCTLELSDPKSRFIVYRFVSGDLKDDNNGEPNMITVYTKDAKPIEGSHLSAGNFYLTGRYFEIKRKADLKEARKEFELEKKYYPRSWQAALGIIDVDLKENSFDEKKTKIKKALEKLYKSNIGNEDAVTGIIGIYERMNEIVRADAIRGDAISKRPKGKIALAKEAAQLRAEKDTEKRVTLLENLLNDFPEMEKNVRQSYQQNLVRAYLQLKNYEKAGELLSTIEKPNPTIYNSIAWPLIEQGDQLDKGILFAKQGVDLLRGQTIADKPSSMRVKEWNENNKYTLAMILDTYGTGLLKAGKNDEALTAFEEAYQQSDGSDPEMNTNYIGAVLKNQKYEKVMELGFSCVKKGKETPAMLDHLKAAYSYSIKSGVNFDSLNIEDKKRYEEMLAEANKIKVEEMRKKILASRISVPAVDFTLKDFNGSSTTLSALKGKVVIVDFWATWCGPCKMSFPYLQKVYEKYLNNESVKFLAVNSWERQKDYSDQLLNAKKFIEENKYTFPVLLDEKTDDQYKVISDYDVEGIPTKFLIDKSGNIAFKSVGFDGPSMEEELTQQIEILLSE